MENVIGNRKAKMAKRLVVFITSPVVLIFIIGCPPVEPKPTEPSKVSQIKPEPNKIEISVVEPNSIESAKVEPNDLKIEWAVSFHDKCADILKNYVNDKGMVNYKILRRKRLQLKTLLDEFNELEPNVYKSWSKEDKIAFWLNAYNIQMLKIITDNYPIEGSRWLNPFYGPNSIRHIKGIWTKYKFLVMDEEFTLSAIDKRFFRREFDDPRIFFAISTASLSSPPLRNEPYYGHRLNEQLEDQVRKFLSSSTSFRIEREERIVYLSAIFQASQYGKEFTDKYCMDRKFKDHEPITRAVLNFITNYISENNASFLEVGNYSVRHIRYDWTINDGS